MQENPRTQLITLKKVFSRDRDKFVYFKLTQNNYYLY
jgi:hypothetical protein